MRRCQSIAFVTISFITATWVIPIELLMLHENGTSERVVVGPDLQTGQCVQLLIPGNTFHTARAHRDEDAGFSARAQNGPAKRKSTSKIGDVEALAAKYPDVADDLRAFQRG